MHIHKTPVPEDCPLCPSNGKVDMLFHSQDAYLTRPRHSPIDDCYFIVPKRHITDVTKLPSRWQIGFQLALMRIPWYTPEAPLTISLNLGYAAGQRLEHLSFWVIPRTEDESMPSRNKGAHALIHALNQTPHQRTMR